MLLDKESQNLLTTEYKEGTSVYAKDPMTTNSASTVIYSVEWTYADGVSVQHTKDSSSVSNIQHGDGATATLLNLRYGDLSTGTKDSSLLGTFTLDETELALKSTQRSFLEG